MQMLYNSDNYAVVLFDLDSATPAAQAAEPSSLPIVARGGYEIVDKFARKEIFIEGEMAERFKAGVEALIQASPAPSEEDIDAYIERFSPLMHHPLVFH